jgi:hypothetical protein
MVKTNEFGTLLSTVSRPAAPQDPKERIEAALRVFFPAWDAQAAADYTYAEMMRKRMEAALNVSDPAVSVAITEVQAQVLAEDWASTVFKELDANWDLVSQYGDNEAETFERYIFYTLKKLLTKLGSQA